MRTLWWRHLDDPWVRLRGRAACRALLVDWWTVLDVSADRSYDLYCSRGADYLCVEVKGTVGAAERVILTVKEVANGRQEYPRTALAIRRHVELDPSRAGSQGGRRGADRALAVADRGRHAGGERFLLHAAGLSRGQVGVPPRNW